MAPADDPPRATVNGERQMVLPSAITGSRSSAFRSARRRASSQITVERQGAEVTSVELPIKSKQYRVQAAARGAGHGGART
jgi:hypothetical protein